jgi:hypothetical protein
MVLLGTQHRFKCESKRGDCFGPNEVGIGVHNTRLFVYKEADSVGPSASVANLNVTNIPVSSRNHIHVC